MLAQSMKNNHIYKHKNKLILMHQLYYFYNTIYDKKNINFNDLGQISIEPKGFVYKQTSNLLFNDMKGELKRKTTREEFVFNNKYLSCTHEPFIG